MNLLARLAPGPEWTLLGLSVLVQVTGVILVAGLLARAALRPPAPPRGMALWLGALVWVLLSPAHRRRRRPCGHVALVGGRCRYPEHGERLRPTGFRTVAAAIGDARAGPRCRVRPSRPQTGASTSSAPAACREAGRSRRPPARSLWPAVLGGVTVVWAAGVLIGLATDRRWAGDGSPR